MRVVLLTLQARIDQGILREAESLVAEGHEVILLASAAEGLARFETIGRVMIERIDAARAEPPPRERYPPLWISVAAAAGRLLMRPIRRAGFGVRRLVQAAWRRTVATASRGLGWLFGKVRRLGSDPLSPWEQAFAWRIEFYQPDVIRVHDQPLMKVAAALL